MILCSPELGISPGSGLGGEVFDREMLKALDNLDVVTLIILPFGKTYPPLKHSKIYFFPTPFVYPPWLFNLLALPYLFYLQWKYKFDVLRVHSPYFVGPAALLFKVFNPKVKIVASYLHIEPNNKVFDFADSNLIKHYSLITTISEATKDDITRKYKVDPEKIAVISCGVDAKYRPLPKNLDLVEKYHLADKKVLLYLGQLIERKNIPFLFKVLKKLPKNYVLMISGDGPMRSELEKMAPDGVIFTGSVPENEKVDYYNLADVFVYASRLEGFGLVAIEAMACGLPTVLSDIPSLREISGEYSSQVCFKLKTDIWASQIEKLFTDKINYSKRVSISLTIAKQFFWKAAAMKYLKFIS